MATVNRLMGQNLRVRRGGSLIDEAINCQVTVSSQTEDTTTKSNAGLWQREDVVSSQVQVQTESYNVGDLGALLSAFGAVVSLQLEIDLDNSTTGIMHGDGILSDLTITANDRQPISYNAQYTSTGEWATGAASTT